MSRPRGSLRSSSNQVFEAIRRLQAEQDVAILIAEQNAGVLDILDTLIVVREGMLGASRAARQADKHDIADYMFGAGTA